MLNRIFSGVLSFLSPVGVLWVEPASATAEPAASGSPGSGAPSNGASGSAAPASTGQPAAGTGTAGTTPPAAAAAGAPAKPTFSYGEDRSRWIPPHRLTEETQKRTTVEGQLAEANKRIAALAGVTPTDPQTAEAEKIREAFFALPGMAHFRALTPDVLRSLLTLAQNGQAISDTARNHWDRHAISTYRKLNDAVAERLGIESLSDRQQQRLNGAFLQMLRSDPEKYRQRYEDGDETLITDFVKEWTDDFFEPVRRSATNGEIIRQPRVPRGGPSAPVTQGAPQIDFTNPQAVEDEAVRRMKEAGHLRER